MQSFRQCLSLGARRTRKLASPALLALARALAVSAEPGKWWGTSLRELADDGKVPGLSPGSPWGQHSLQRRFPPLSQDTTADVVVVGGGLAGLTCAYHLAKGGKSVVVLESRVRGGGQSGRRAAHVMTWLDDHYHRCELMHGAHKTRLVAESLGAALKFIERTSQEEGIECRFQRVDGFLVAPHAADGFGSGGPGGASTAASPHLGPSAAAEGLLAQELEAALKAGLADTERVELGGGPEVGGHNNALRFPNNAQFQPLLYLDGLADAVVRHGGRVYEGSKFSHAEAQRAWTAEGHSIRGCQHVVLATHSPIHHNPMVHARQQPFRRYGVGLKVPRSGFRRGLYWDVGAPFRCVRADDLDEDHYLLIVAGEDHKTGMAPPHDPHMRLAEWARARWPATGEMLRAWSGQVMQPADMLWLAGHDALKPGSNTYIITGDSGQGGSCATIGGWLVADLILGRPNPWADLYDPSRHPPVRSLPGILEEERTTLASLAERVLPLHRVGHSDDHDVAPGTGVIVQRGLHKVALYCDESGQKHACSAVCKHAGCLVHWNPVDKSWDCRCHGSHYDPYGRVINGPAKADLDRLVW